MNQLSTSNSRFDRLRGICFGIWVTVITLLLIFNTCLTLYIADYVFAKQRIETIFKSSKSR